MTTFFESSKELSWSTVGTYATSICVDALFINNINNLDLKTLDWGRLQADMRSGHSLAIKILLKLLSGVEGDALVIANRAEQLLFDAFSGLIKGVDNLPDLIQSACFQLWLTLRRPDCTTNDLVESSGLSARFNRPSKLLYMSGAGAYSAGNLVEFKQIQRIFGQSLEFNHFDTTLKSDDLFDSDRSITAQEIDTLGARLDNRLNNRRVSRGFNCAMPLNRHQDIVAFLDHWAIKLEPRLFRASRIANLRGEEYFPLSIENHWVLLCLFVRHLEGVVGPALPHAVVFSASKGYAKRSDFLTLMRSLGVRSNCVNFVQADLLDLTPNASGVYVAYAMQALVDSQLALGDICLENFMNRITRWPQQERIDFNLFFRRQLLGACLKGK